MTTASIRFLRLGAASGSHHAFGKELVEACVRACRSAGWVAEDHGEWPVSDSRWDPDFRVNVSVAGTRARICFVPPYREGQIGRVFIEGIESDDLRAEVARVVCRALAALPRVEVVLLTADS